MAIPKDLVDGGSDRSASGSRAGEKEVQDKQLHNSNPGANWSHRTQGSLEQSSLFERATSSRPKDAPGYNLGHDGGFSLLGARRDEPRFSLLDERGEETESRFHFADYDLVGEFGRAERCRTGTVVDLAERGSRSIFNNSSGSPYIHDFSGGVHDFLKNYCAMEKAWTKDVDKYFHCMAHCEAAQRGDGGLDAAALIGISREATDLFRNPAPTALGGKGMTVEASVRDSMEDIRANLTGARGGKSGTRCEDACDSLKPRGFIW